MQSKAASMRPHDEHLSSLFKAKLVMQKKTHTVFIYIFYGIGRVFHLEILNVAFFPYTKYFKRRRIGAYSKQKMNEREREKNKNIKIK